MMLEALSPLGGAFGEPHALADITLAEVTERSDLGALLITAIEPGSERAKSIGLAIGCSLPMTHGLVVECGDKRAIWLTPRSWLILCNPSDEEHISRSVQAKFPDRTVLASRFSDALGWLTLEGERAEALLTQGSFVTFDATGLAVGSAKRTLVAGIPVVIQRESEMRWTVGVERSRAQYFVDWLKGLTLSFGESP